MRLSPSVRSTLLRGVLALGTLSLLAASVASAQVPVNNHRRTFHSETPFPWERFGTSADADGTTVVIGAIGDDAPGPSTQGRAEVWIIDPSTPGSPRLEAVLTPTPAPAPGDRFGWSVAIYRDAIVVGAPGSDLAGPNFGAAYIFERTGGPHSPVWTQTAQLLPPSSGNTVASGFSVDIHGGLAVVGHVSSDFGVMAFEKQLTGWSQVSGGLDYSSGGSWGFGSSVAVVGSLIAVGMPGYTDDFEEGVEVGAVVVFRRNPRSRNYPWTEADLITAGEAVNFEAIGSGVAMSWNDTLGTPQLVLAAGTAYGVRLWYLSKQGQALGTGGHYTDPTILSFGRHFDLEGDTLLISGDETSASQGVSMRRRNLLGQWPQAVYFIPPTPPELEGWGGSLAISHDFLVVGSAGADPGGINNGGWASWVSALRH